MQKLAGQIDGLAMAVHRNLPGHRHDKLSRQVFTMRFKRAAVLGMAVSQSRGASWISRG